MASSLLKSVSLVSLMTFVSRILGFARDLIAAQLFGVNAAVDAFYIAFKIPNFMRNLFAEGSFSQAFVPVLANYQEKNRKEEVLRFISHMAGALILILSLLTALVLWKTEYLIALFSPGLDDFRFNLATEMLRITFPYLMLISLTAFAGAILNNYGRFGLPSFTPALLNICLIITALGFSHCFLIPVNSQAWGILIAGFLQLFVQLIGLYRLGFLVRPRLSWQDKGVRRVLKLIIPALFGASMGQLSILANTVLASFLVTGSITWLYYSERLAYFPLGTFGVALATVILPHLSRQHANQSQERFAKALDWGLRWNLIIGIPAALTMLLLSGPLIVSLYDYGKFTVEDIIMTQRSVITYGIGLPAFMLAKILSAAFYARQDIRTPVTVSMISLGLNILLSVALVWPLAHAGLALSTSLSSWVNVIGLGWLLHKRKIFPLQLKSWLNFFLRLFFANILVAVFLYFASADLTTWIQRSWHQRLSYITLLGVGSCAIYFFSLWFSKALPKRE